MAEHWLTRYTGYDFVLAAYWLLVVKQAWKQLHYLMCVGQAHASQTVADISKLHSGDMLLGQRYALLMPCQNLHLVFLQHLSEKQHFYKLDLPEGVKGYWLRCTVYVPRRSTPGACVSAGGNSYLLQTS